MQGVTRERKIISTAGDDLDLSCKGGRGQLKQVPAKILLCFLGGILGLGLLLMSSAQAAKPAKPAQATKAAKGTKGKYGKLNVEGALKSELNGLLQSASGLHLACVAQSDKRINENIRQVLTSIKSTAKKTSLAKDQKPHLTRMLDKSRQHLEASLSRSGDARRESLKEAFNDLVQIARFYKLDQYQIFFCPSDKVVWLQKGFQPRNPINPKKFGACGKLVR